MARKLRVQFPGAIYHVTLRGVGRCKIFVDDASSQRFIDRLAAGVELDEVRLYMFCLMSNHAHLVFETPRANLSQFMHRLETSYTVYFNLRQNRTGHLMQGRYGAKLVEGDEYLLRLSRYLHQNPVQIRRFKHLELKERVRDLRKYRWSTYRSYTGLAPELDFVDYGPVHNMLAGKRVARKREYRKFVESGLAETDEEFMSMLKQSALSIGSDQFMVRIRDLHTELTLERKRPEDVSLRRMSESLPASQVIAMAAAALGVSAGELRYQRRDSLVRPLLARMLCKHAGLSQRDVADRMGLKSGAAVSQQLKKLASASEEDAGIRKQIEDLDELFQSQRSS